MKPLGSSPAVPLPLPLPLGVEAPLGAPVAECAASRLWRLCSCAHCSAAPMLFTPPRLPLRDTAGGLLERPPLLLRLLREATVEARGPSACSQMGRSRAAGRGAWKVLRGAVLVVDSETSGGALCSMRT